MKRLRRPLDYVSDRQEKRRIAERVNDHIANILAASACGQAEVNLAVCDEDDRGDGASEGLGPLQAANVLSSSACRQANVSLTVDEEDDTSDGASEVLDPLQVNTIVPSPSPAERTETQLPSSSKDELSLASEVATWACETKSCASHVSWLLMGTLMGIPRSCNVKSMGSSGVYQYFGIEPTLKQMMRSGSIPGSSISLLINVDGLPIAKSSSKQFWPILASVAESYEREPFVVALYVGDNKPESLHEYLGDYF